MIRTSAQWLLPLLTIMGLCCFAHAQEQLTGKHDTKLPIEISSDSLEVLQHENKAIFKGSVVAVQGEMRLKSDVMIVHYKQSGQQNGQSAPNKPAAVTPAPGTPAGGASGAVPGSMGAITRIEVEGHVFMATPQESATGDKGDYDVASQMLHLFGNNVTLTRDKNILKGTALEYNFATGRSVLTNGSGPVTGNGARVRGVFVPADDKK